ncbi:hypothetical protein [Spirosoma endophyticum]|uniref:Uncharacterized protein n=1 Tax=Spirosoma endophyticum TaxID=662367 RepID=A0A1I2GWQ4_9BACT|nr:hypothetical protein [Spirosoma endophyticum]SFF22145.1 hypothetical protein SAMN05216167_13625 [Spirosoma endophyticum]
MNELKTIPELFAGSEINPQVVMCYIWRQDSYYKQTIQGPHHPQFLYLIQEADKVDYEMRWFLAGNSVYMTKVYKVIQHFVDLNPSVSRGFTGLVLEDIHTTLLLNRWYELLPRFELARNRIRKRFKL